MTLDQIRVSLARGTCTPAGLKRYECTQRRIDFVTRKRHLHPGRIETSSMCVIAVNPSKLARGTCTPAGLKPIRAPAHCLDILFLARGTCTPAGLKLPFFDPVHRGSILARGTCTPAGLKLMEQLGQFLCLYLARGTCTPAGLKPPERAPGSRLAISRQRHLHPGRIETLIICSQSRLSVRPRKRRLHPSRIETPLLAVRSPPLGNSQEAPAPRQD